MNRSYRKFAYRAGVVVALLGLGAAGLADCKCLEDNDFIESAMVCASACDQRDEYCGGADSYGLLGRAETEQACSNCITLDLDLPGRSARLQNPDTNKDLVDPSNVGSWSSRLEQSTCEVGSRSPASLIFDSPPLSTEELATTVLRC